jgi:hypothetical protein
LTRTHITDLQNAIKTLRKIRSELDAIERDIRDVLNHPKGYLWHEEVLGPYDDATDVTVTVKRKELSATGDPKDFAKAEMNFGGGPRFVVAGGLTYTELEKQEFQRLSVGPVPTIGLKENSDTRLKPMLMLHGRLFPIGSLGFDAFHASIGITAKNENNETDIEYLLGTSFSFLREQMFLTVGAYGSRQQRLEGGLFVGGPAPMGEPPVRKEWHWKIGIGISFKIPGLNK